MLNGEWLREMYDYLNVKQNVGVIGVCCIGFKPFSHLMNPYLLALLIHCLTKCHSSRHLIFCVVSNPFLLVFNLLCLFSEKFQNKITWVMIVIRCWFYIIHNWWNEFVARTIWHTCCSIAYREILFYLESIKEKRIKSSAQ